MRVIGFLFLLIISQASLSETIPANVTYSVAASGSKVTGFCYESQSRVKAYGYTLSSCLAAIQSFENVSDRKPFYFLFHQLIQYKLFIKFIMLNPGIKVIFLHSNLTKFTPVLLVIFCPILLVWLLVLVSIALKKLVSVLVIKTQIIIFWGVVIFYKALSPVFVMTVVNIQIRRVLRSVGQNYPILIILVLFIIVLLVLIAAGYYYANGTDYVVLLVMLRPFLLVHFLRCSRSIHNALQILLLPIKHMRMLKPV